MNQIEFILIGYLIFTFEKMTYELEENHEKK